MRHLIENRIGLHKRNVFHRMRKLDKTGFQNLRRHM